ncbi:MAG: proline dehydrogenase [Gemmatimonadetes bacterium]|uniref:Proline dehydrogenase n=1 Tax=Candidatus Kutchimonas denitrificans TaxID=3056748 RepID=A0AAE4ZB78_9BACT|nr:proline dehydrogenase [Gemmatimonadota bacterium]NIR75651.1 proline dehydrogenase [Candidatus Kutchimonas denitrificans]NIR99630.1 proline dehydrogenase [Gemmatimonadota bacterium]NIT65905.1 proline dehydrogenase [Gemmatimonadota bacterium]NIV22074.1 proline dehydrogenase [Gemmatimonadota bacterium]
MRIWQQAMIRAARSSKAKSIMESWAPASSLARRFVAGFDLSEALRSCGRLRDEGLRASLYYLGEYVSDQNRIRHTVERKKAAARALAEDGFDVHLSVEPTQIGQLVSRETLWANAEAIARTVAESSRRRPGDGFDALMLNMDDVPLVDVTLSLYRHLIDFGLPAALTLQAYLRRTESDLAPLISRAARIRLVKGAFAAGPEVAFTRPEGIRDSYLRLSRRMLSRDARTAGFYPIFATHDGGLVEEIIGIADDAGWSREAYEFEMLYGVRREYQRSLQRRGLRVRVYAPFGEDWWPYAVRRIGESPGNAQLLLRALLPG